MSCFLNVGSNGDKVIKLQTELYRLRYYRGKIDGKYGPVTQAAVKAYQTVKHLVIDGCIGNETWGSLFPPAKTSSVHASQKITASTKDPCYKSPRFLNDKDLKQDTNYFCACNVSQQVLFELFGIRVPESELAREEGTTTDGTGHDGIKAGIIKEAKDHGHKVSVEFVNWSSKSLDEIGEMIADPNTGIFVHDKYKETWGHYEYLTGLCKDKSTVIVANSLSGGYMETRPISTLVKWINMINQPSLGIVRTIS
ncbi:peptidoglycan-binding domain-containing protein [Methanobacterium sp.]|uniref:peptidoglycan-binding domain-containing protein n=1 Tax=Methanobacterium sp. TaxID=2164 RepID=UPI003C76BB65